MTRARGTGNVSPHGKGHRARLRTPAGRVSLGVHPTPEAAAAALEHARTAYTPDMSRALTVAAWGAHVLERREREGYAEVGRSIWHAHVEGTALAALPLAAVRRRDVRDWLAIVDRKRARAGRHRGERLARQSVQNALNLVRAIFQACEAIPSRDRLWMGFAIGTGIREGEMFNLRLDDVRLEGRHPEITIRRGSATRGPKNTRGAKSKIRRVPLFGLVLEALRTWLALLPAYCKSNPHKLVFPGPTGARRQPGKHLHRTERPELPGGGKGTPRPVDPLPAYLAAAGIARGAGEVPVTWHSFRHTCAASLVSGLWGRRWSLEEVRGLLGHSSITVTERYAHLADSAVRRAAEETERGGRFGVLQAIDGGKPEPARTRKGVAS
jgi:integrase